MKYYSEPQLELLRILRILGCLQQRQAHTLLRLCFGTSEAAVNSIIRQLKCSGDIRVDKNSGCLTVSTKANAQLILHAVDIALAFSAPDNPPQILHCRDPYILTAFYPNKNIRLNISHVPIGTEEIKCAEISYCLSGCQITTLSVILLDAESQISTIQMATPCILAYPDKNGKLKMKNYTNIQGGI